MMDAECKDGKKTSFCSDNFEQLGLAGASLADCEAVGGYGKSPALLVVATDTA